MKFSCNIFPIKIWVEIEDDGDGNDAKTEYGPGCGSTIIFYKKSKTDWEVCLIHEIIHAVSHGLREIGIEHTEETEEAYTYTIQYFHTKIRKYIKKKKLLK